MTQTQQLYGLDLLEPLLQQLIADYRGEEAIDVVHRVFVLNGKEDTLLNIYNEIRIPNKELEDEDEDDYNNWRCEECFQEVHEHTVYCEDCYLQIEDKKTILDWLANGSTGASSVCLALAALGVDQRKGYPYPLDPSDFGRCLLLIEAAPIAKPGLQDLALVSEPWNALCQHWNEIAVTLRSEVGDKLDWSAGKLAPKTYLLIKNVIANAGEED